MRRVALALRGAAALLLAPCVALAQPPAASVGTYQVPQPGGGTINNCAVQVGALPFTVFHPCHVMETVDQYSVPHPIGPSNPLPIANAQEHTDLQALQASAAAIVSALGAPLQTGGGVSVTSSVLPAGAATSAGQTAAQTSLGAIAASIAVGATAANQTSAASQAHSDAQAIAAAAAAPGLAAGAATSAAQSTGNTSLATIASQTAGLATAAGQASGLSQASATAANTAADAAANAAFQGAVNLTVGVADTQARRSVGAVCTAAGNLTLVLADASTITVPEAVGFQTYPFAATQASASTGACSLYNLK